MDYGGFDINVDVLESILDGNLKSPYIFFPQEMNIATLDMKMC